MSSRRGFVSLVAALVLLLTAVSVTSAVPAAPPTTEIEKYLVIAMADDADTRPFQMSCTELGADRIVLSTTSSPTWTQLDGCLPNLVSTFGTGRWNTATDPDSVDGAATLFQGIDWSGTVALTSDNSVFDASNSLVFSSLGIQSGRPSGTPIGSVSNTDHYFDPDQTPVPNPISLANGVSIGNDFSTLLADLTAWKAFILSLPADETLTSIETPYDFTDSVASNGALGTGLRTTFTNSNPLDDSFIVVDFNIQGDFSMTNLDWVIDSEGGELIIFRILNGANMTMQNTSILMHASDFGNDNQLGAIFFHASESSGSGDTVFTIGNNTVLNGVGLWDLNAVGEGGSTKTNVSVNNGQGCAQFISQKVNFQNGRWVRCVKGIPTAVTLSSFGADSSYSPFVGVLVAFMLLAATFVILRKVRLVRA
jgi:hypothetical protein